MDRDQLIDTIRPVIDDYLDHVGTDAIDTDDLAETIAAALERNGLTA